ncbi:DnaT-like ssDNA-binding protein [Sinorhizobium meliloti]|uniref:DnaT-like ssDNA-binding protein n=1 Tax=Rhizobium meliloti TaxID=382 RepID=UPI00399C281D
MRPGNPAWSASGDTQREAALLRASEAIDGIYGMRFRGKKASRTQVRAWPPIGAVDHCADQPIPETETPVEIETATYALPWPNCSLRARRRRRSRWASPSSGRRSGALIASSSVPKRACRSPLKASAQC